LPHAVLLALTRPLIIRAHDPPFFTVRPPPCPSLFPYTTLFRSRRPLRRPRPAAPAARTQGDLARMAAAALSRACRARDEPGAADARRQRLRRAVRQADARRGAVRGPDRGALRPRLPALGIRAVAGAGCDAVRGAEEAVAAGRFVLTRTTLLPLPLPLPLILILILIYSF